MGGGRRGEKCKLDMRQVFDIQGNLLIFFLGGLEVFIVHFSYSQLPRYLQLGRLCERVPTHLLAGCPGAVELEPCGAGSLYGFSSDVVRWIVETQQPEESGHR